VNTTTLNELREAGVEGKVGVGFCGVVTASTVVVTTGDTFGEGIWVVIELGGGIWVVLELGEGGSEVLDPLPMIVAFPEPLETTNTHCPLVSLHCQMVTLSSIS
jgi:hypothetical protein